MSGRGTGAWVLQRVTSFLVLLLGAWFVFSIARLVHTQGYAYLSVVDWVTQPLTAFLALLFFLVALLHSALGLEEVMQDYIHGPGKNAALWGMKLLHAVGAIVVVMALLKLMQAG